MVKDASGEPTRVLENAQSLVKGLDRTERFTEAEKLDALEQQLKRYVAAGLSPRSRMVPLPMSRSRCIKN